MKTINGNASVVLGMFLSGELEQTETVYSEVNRQAYKFKRNGEYVGLEAVTA